MCVSDIFPTDVLIKGMHFHKSSQSYGFPELYFAMCKKVWYMFVVFASLLNGCIQFVFMADTLITEEEIIKHFPVGW